MLVLVEMEALVVEVAPVAALAMAAPVAALEVSVCLPLTCEAEASRQAPYCSSLTCSIHSTTSPIKAS